MIEFREGEKFCRWNGVLMTQENYEDLFGVVCDPQLYDDKFVEYDDTIYTDYPLDKVISILAEIYGEIRGEEPEWDPILTQGAGFTQYAERKHVENTFIIPQRSIQGLKKLKPYADFKKDCPKFDEKKFLEYGQELDDFYENIRRR